ncbi:CvpA family protein [Campylobacter sp. LR291e]|nr:CvpA family protein [Campylobacter sp. LR185c]KAA6228623.1 CvpA family protein [Campylobacter sp. LR196d]KAA6229176.1 CvpA family protein [Campylobacter sp. LR286c]KAA6233967.1 CvpA family protein [Campylobacter sp. LR291e]KAA6234206.1 CvpA family protein [Campylobacter sp. LR264d]
MNFYWFDVLILGFTFLLGLKGGVNGLVKEIFGLIGIIGGVFIAAVYSDEAAKFIQENLYNIDNKDLASFAGFLSILIIFWIICLILGSFIARLVKFSGLSFLDRIGGFIFGSAKVFLIFAILVFCIEKIGPLKDKLDSFAKDSYTLSVLKNTGAYIMNQPLAQNPLQELKQDINSNIQELGQNIQEGTQELKDNVQELKDDLIQGVQNDN